MVHLLLFLVLSLAPSAQSEPTRSIIEGHAASNAAIAIDTVNARVGIGTGTPQAVLDVRSAANTQSVLVSSNVKLSAGLLDLSASASQGVKYFDGSTSTTAALNLSSSGGGGSSQSQSISSATWSTNATATSNDFTNGEVQASSQTILVANNTGIVCTMSNGWLTKSGGSAGDAWGIMFTIDGVAFPGYPTSPGNYGMKSFGFTIGTEKTDDIMFTAASGPLSAGLHNVSANMGGSGGTITLNCTTDGSQYPHFDHSCRLICVGVH